MINRRTTQKDIAHKLGITQATVSRALKNDPRIPLETRRRVIDQADSMGYRPDPVLSALIDYRRANSLRPFQGTIAFLCFGANRKRYLESPFAAGCLAGCQAAAERLGYRLELFEDAPDGSSRLIHILKARGVQGLIIGPETFTDSLYFRPEHADGLTCLAMGRFSKDIDCTQVSPNHFQAVKCAYKKAVEAGYQRIALVLREQNRDVSNGRWVAGYLHAIFEQGTNLSEALPIGFYAAPDSFLEWQRKHRADAIITSDVWMAKRLRIITAESYPDLGFISLSVPATDSTVSGIIQNPEIVGRSALNHLVQLIRTGAPGSDESKSTILIDGVWFPGTTLRRGNV
jgi:DNA-binding LacI/PurR family transcriptional regulator